MVFLSHPSKGIFAGDCSVNSDRIDNQLAILDPRGRLLGRESYGKTFNLTPYDFAPVFSMANFKKMGNDEDKENLAMFQFQNFQGMYPSALVVGKEGVFLALCSPGSIEEIQVLKNSNSGLSLLVLGNNNLVSHLAYLTEWNTSPAKGRRWEIFPTYNLDSGCSPADFLVFVPSPSQIIENHWLSQGLVVLFAKQGDGTITVHRDGKLEVSRKGQVLVYQDRPEILAQVNGLINESIQQKTVSRNPEKSAGIGRQSRRPTGAEPLPEIGAPLPERGTGETAMGRYREGKKSLQEAMQYFPRNNDAMQRLLDIVFFQQGPLAAIETMEKSYSQSRNFFGLGQVGQRLFLGNLHLAAGQMEKAREYFERMLPGELSLCQESPRRDPGDVQGKLRAGLPLSAPGRSPAARFFHRQGIQAVPGPQPSPGPGGADPCPLDPGRPGQVLFGARAI